MDLNWEDLADGCCGSSEGNDAHAPEEGHTGFNRRSLLVAAGVSPFAAAGFTSLAPAPAFASPSGVVRAALHIHSSFGEGAGGLRTWDAPNQTLASMESHTHVLRQLGFDMCMFTDHDHRMAAEVPGSNAKPFLEVEDMTRPTLAYLSNVVGDTGAAGDFQFNGTGLRVTAKEAPNGYQMVFASCDATNWNYRANITNTTMTLTLDTPRRGQTGEFWMKLSYRPAINGRPEGNYTLRYVLSPDADTRSVTRDGLQGIITIPVAESADGYTVTFEPENDFARAFPDLGDLSRDNGLYGIWFGASSNRGTATVTFRRLRIDRDFTLGSAMALQRDLIDRLSSKYSGIFLAQGLELSYGLHVNWIAGRPGAFGQRPHGRPLTEYIRSCVNVIRENGGAASYNHMFGALRGPLLTGAEYRAKIDKTAKQLLASGAYGCDILEVGYNIRGGVDLAAHLEVWDIMLAAGYRIYANGTTDNHQGIMRSYQMETNQFATDIYAASPDPAVATPQLIRGRAFNSMFTRFGGRIDLSADGATMGGTTYYTTESKVPVKLTIEDAPVGTVVRAVQYGIHRNKSEFRRRPPIRQYEISKLDVAPQTTVLDFNPAGSYVRFELIKNRQVIAFSNPLFLRRA